MEFAINEKVAMETTGAAAISGVCSLTTMKHVGMNVAANLEYFKRRMRAAA